MGLCRKTETIYFEKVSWFIVLNFKVDNSKLFNNENKILLRWIPFPDRWYCYSLCTNFVSSPITCFLYKWEIWVCLCNNFKSIFWIWSFALINCYEVWNYIFFFSFSPVMTWIKQDTHNYGLELNKCMVTFTTIRWRLFIVQ